MPAATAHIMPLLKSSGPYVLLGLSETLMHDRMLSSAALTASAIAHFRVVQSGSTQAQNGSPVLRTKLTQGIRIMYNDHLFEQVQFYRAKQTK